MVRDKSSSGKKRPRVLVVDDEQIVCDPIAASLRSAGFDANCATNGEEALKLIATHTPDLLILDVHMPSMDGMALLARLRERPATAELPVILLTCESDRKIILEAAKLGVREYVLKSRFKLNEFLQRIERCLNAPPTAAPTAKRAKSAA